MKPTHARFAKAVNSAKSPSAGVPSGVQVGAVQYAVVKSLQAGPPQTATITLAGSTQTIAGVAYLASYTPVVNDTVMVMGNGNDYVIMGALATPLVNPAGRLIATAQTVIGSGAITQVTGLAGDFGNGNITVASNSITINVAGIYIISGGIGWQNAGGPVPAGRYITFIYKNGNEFRRCEEDVFGTPSGAQPNVDVCDIANLAVNDVLKLYCFQSSGANQATNAGSNLTWLSAAKIPSLQGS